LSKQKLQVNSKDIPDDAIHAVPDICTGANKDAPILNVVPKRTGSERIVSVSAVPSEIGIRIEVDVWTRGSFASNVKRVARAISIQPLVQHAGTSNGEGIAKASPNACFRHQTGAVLYSEIIGSVIVKDGRLIDFGRDVANPRIADAIECDEVGCMCVLKGFC
jgi:hypothetical protein